MGIHSCGRAWKRFCKDRETTRQPGTTFRIQDRRNLIYGFSGRLRNTALTIKSEFFSQKDAGSKANHPLVRHRMLLAVEIASGSKLSGSNRECNAFCRSGNLRKGRWFKKKCMHFILRNTCITRSYFSLISDPYSLRSACSGLRPVTPCAFNQSSTRSKIGSHR